MTIQRNFVRGALLAGVLTGCAGAQSLERMNFSGNESLMVAATAPAAFSSSVGSLDLPVTEMVSTDMPEAPSTVMQEAQKLKDGDPNAAPAAKRVSRLAAATGQAGPEAPEYTKYIPAGYVTHRQNLREKELTGAEDLYSFGNFAAMFLSAGYSHITNGQPNYGTDKGAFGQRLGAAAIRETSQGVFTDMVFSPILHQDLRYYVRGPQHNVFDRTLYAVSRVFVARRDTTSTTINSALFLGYAATAAIEPLYYPKINRNFNDVASSFGGSIGGAALGNVFSEFQSDIEVALHLKKKP